MKTKRCSTCKETKPVSEFYKRGDRKDALRSQCKKCISKTERRYKEANKEKIAERTRRYQRANREKENEKARRYREANKNQISRRMSKFRKEIQKRSLECAHRQGQPWEDWEDEFVLSDNGLTEYQKAVKLKGHTTLLDTDESD